MGDLVPIKIPPGMFRNGTEYESSGRWYDGNMVRWENDRMKPVGGWQALFGPGVHFTGVARGGIAWEDNSGFKYLAIGTNQRLYLGEGEVFDDLTPVDFIAGRADSGTGAGYGSGPYGAGTYGTSRAAGTLQLEAATWSFDTLGETIVCICTSDKRLFQFDPSTGLLTVPAGSPMATAVMTTNEDYVLMLGAGGESRKIQWPDIGTTTVWTPSDTNSAGDIQLNTGGRSMCGARVGTQNLVWTDTDVHLINFVGSPGIYGPVRIAENCGIVGPNAYAVTDIAYWWGIGGFYRYNGLVQPLECDVQDYIFRQVNTEQFAKIYGETNSRFNEITWHFPSVNSTECDSYVTFNYKRGVWYFGIGSALGARTTWIDRGTFPLPVAVDPDGVIYQHETGYLANGVTRVGQIFAQSGPAEIGNGDKVIYANLMLPDVDGASSLTMTAKTRQAPAGPLSTGSVTPMLANGEGYVPVRIAGRQVALRFDQTADTDWSLGKSRLKIAGGGGR